MPFAARCSISSETRKTRSPSLLTTSMPTVCSSYAMDASSSLVTLRICCRRCRRTRRSWITRGTGCFPVSSTRMSTMRRPTSSRVPASSSCIGSSATRFRPKRASPTRLSRAKPPIFSWPSCCATARRRRWCFRRYTRLRWMHCSKRRSRAAWPSSAARCSWIVTAPSSSATRRRRVTATRAS